MAQIFWYLFLAGFILGYFAVGVIIYQLAFGGLEKKPPFLTLLAVVGGWPVFMVFCFYLSSAFAPPGDKKK